MHSTKVCHKIMNDAFSWMHKLRLNLVKANVLAAIHEKRRSVTDLGRVIESHANEKQGIKRADRLLSNPNLYNAKHSGGVQLERIVMTRILFL